MNSAQKRGVSASESTDGQAPQDYPSAFVFERQKLGAEVRSNTNASVTDTSDAVVIAIVKDPERLLRERGLAFHGDVVDLLTDLIIEAIERGEPND